MKNAKRLLTIPLALLASGCEEWNIGCSIEHGVASAAYNGSSYSSSNIRDEFTFDDQVSGSHIIAINSSDSYLVTIMITNQHHSAIEITGSSLAYFGISNKQSAPAHYDTCTKERCNDQLLTASSARTVNPGESLSLDFTYANIPNSDSVFQEQFTLNMRDQDPYIRVEDVKSVELAYNCIFGSGYAFR